MPHLPPLRADVCVAPDTLAQSIRDGDHPFDWSPIASTLIWGQYSAVLVDAAIPIKQDLDLADWVDSPHKPQSITLESIYISPLTSPFTEILPESHTIELDVQTDTHDTSVLWVVDIQLVVAVDVVCFGWNRSRRWRRWSRVTRG